MMRFKGFLFACACALLAACASPEAKVFTPGEIWPDNNGVHINAHGGGVLFHNGTYYWYGEHKVEGERGNQAWVGVHVYSSTNLYNWTDEGIALPMSTDTTSLLVEGSVVERPKVIYNQKTGKFVMWFHHELKGRGYEAALTGLALSDSPTGPFEYVKSVRPNVAQWPINMNEEQKADTVTLASLEWWTEPWYNAVHNGLFVRRDFETGQMARDMTLFVDDDGKAYHIHSAEENLTLHISELTDDYTDFTGVYAVMEPAGHNEAPAVFKKDGKYYMITSGCTGWAPNAARSFVADNILGPWTSLGNPSRGTEEEVNTTFNSQSTYILPVQGQKDKFIFMADRWTPKNAIDGRYIWLPIEFENDLPILRWQAQWSL